MSRVLMTNCGARTRACRVHTRVNALVHLAQSMGQRKIRIYKENA